ncbi:hypothetical protein SAMN04487910_2915 [Aquimarina amphilecti]|uniref:Uncharacterized protein n=1 Tax=Aquimarina amphilecti TaxID=1038014 RepID=A0A1H7RY38_AQUAM|nr:hypothetical protein SAMN04487910_2915 [Aquimarina amphilecti]
MPVRQNINNQDKWKLSTKIIFRFSFVYLFLNIFPFPFYYIGLIPGMGNIFLFIMMDLNSYAFGLEKTF